jgi:hypothetical protein
MAAFRVSVGSTQDLTVQTMESQEGCRHGMCGETSRQLSNSPSPSLQLQQDLSNFIARLHVSTSPRKDDQQQSNESRSHIIKQANRPRKYKNINNDKCSTK